MGVRPQPTAIRRLRVADSPGLGTRGECLATRRDPLAVGRFADPREHPLSGQSLGTDQCHSTPLSEAGVPTANGTEHRAEGICVVDSDNGEVACLALQVDVSYNIKGSLI